MKRAAAWHHEGALGGSWRRTPCWSHGRRAPLGSSMTVTRQKLDNQRINRAG
jgi:hypothetical protein